MIYVILLKGDTMKKEIKTTKKEKTVKKVEMKKKKNSNLSDYKIDKHAKDKNTRQPKGSVFGISEVVGLVMITMIISLLMGSIITYSVVSKKYRVQEDEYTKEIIKNYNYIVDNYYDEIEKKELVDGAIKGMIETLDDEHSSFIDEQNNTNFDKTLEGSYEGIGVEVYSSNDYIIVIRCFEGSPAYKAGIRADDKIIKFNDENLKGKEATVLSNYITKQSTNKTFTLTYERNGEQKKVEMKKQYVVIPSVVSKIYNKNDKKIGYISVSQFSATTYNQFKKALNELEKQNVDSLVIDLRDNSGGHLSVVADMLSLFMDKSHVIYQIETKKETTKYYSTGKTTKTIPIVVLQNNGSASASELMSSALQEQLGAKVVGTTSYGKGTVQELIDLTDGNEYKFTTKKWLTSNGNWINKKGVTPNVEVNLDQKYYETGSEEDDNQLQTALLEAVK